MCPPNKKQSAPAASTTPTMQAAEELELITDGLQDNAIGRAALRTKGAAAGGARKPASASTSAAVVTGGSAPTAARTAVAATVDAVSALGFGTDQGRTPGARQDFYNPGGSVEA
jgi:hypothetical protein